MWRAACAVLALLCAAAASAAVQRGFEGRWDIRWDRGPAGWTPQYFTGALVLARRGKVWSGTLAFEQGDDAKLPVKSMRVTGDRAVMTLADPSSKGVVEIALWLREQRLVGELRWGEEIGWTPFSGKRPARLADAQVERSLPHGSASALDPAAWNKLAQAAEDTHTTALVIVKDGKIVAEKYREGFDRGTIVAMSASKSIVSMAIGALIDDGKLKLETTLGELFPETRGTPKQKITVLQLLNHTSGIDAARCEPKESIRAHVLASPVVFEPGSCFQYNNNAVDFLAVVAQQAAGEPMDTYLEKRLFAPLGITGAEWMKDVKGVPRGAGELIIRPVDLAKLGQLMLDGGTWNGQRLLSSAWIERSVAASQEHSAECGLLWWREGTFHLRMTPCVLEAWKRAGLDAAAIERARALIGRSFANGAAYNEAVDEALGEEAAAKLAKLQETAVHLPRVMRAAEGPVTGYSARGMLGQWLVVIPGKRLVGVRMRGGPGVRYDDPDAREYRAFADDLGNL